ncbi:uncharacterized protein JN550_003016 [Neoarthrinium moseri]|uniref:uncharacterized protein n=1 Tax=Neoarthrinium moseri TaxID=1658444 RepID=UPI001FDCA68A|nr:uncharacterized protein JN550_003016 [Neoarthrinium moseri]KAI1873747.1 hypothetical protein JN550_003016 [Neoarthrinium moseri]
MHELFLTAALKDGDIEKACAVLQGLCWMSARHNVYHLGFYAGPPKARGLPNVKSLPPNRYSAQWHELSRELTRSSYVFHLVHEVLKDRDFGTGNAMIWDNMPGTLRWAGFPDPEREKDQVITYRKKIDIPDQKGLLTIMAGNGQGYKTELIQETYSFIRDNMEFIFSRYYHLPPSPEQSGPSTSLPAWSDLKPVDPARKWTFSVKRDVLEDGQPEKMKQASKGIAEVRAELDSMFSFKAIDRRIFDTRIAAPQVMPGQQP